MDPISRPQYNLLFGAIGLITAYKNTLDRQTDGCKARESTEIVVKLYMEVKCTSDIYRML